MKTTKEIVDEMEKPHAQVSPEAYERFKKAVNEWWDALPEDEKRLRTNTFRRSIKGAMP